MTSVDADEVGLARCHCERPEAERAVFELHRTVGVDATDGRFADVTIDRCRSCGRLWLCYAVEYESRPRSGRWARGLISSKDAEGIAPHTAVAHLERLDAYIAGGSYLGGVAAVRSRPMYWGG